MEMCDLASYKRGTPRGGRRTMRLPFVCPYRSILQPQIEFAYIMDSFPAGTVIRCILIVNRGTFP